MEDNLIILYKNIKKSGYDLFNIDDPFYNDICSPYKSENGTDVLLSDRKNDIYNNNYTTCQANCQYSSFNPEYKFLKCECKVIMDDIDVKNTKKLNKKIIKNFYDVLKNSNYKVMKCYKLVFNLSNFKKNIGSIIVLCFFIIYIGFFIIYIIEGISPLKVQSLRNLFNNKKVELKNNNNNSNNTIIITKKKKRKSSNAIIKKEVINYPPKKKKSTISIIAGTNNNKEKKEKRKSHGPLNREKNKLLNERSSKKRKANIPYERDEINEISPCKRKSHLPFNKKKSKIFKEHSSHMENHLIRSKSKIAIIENSESKNIFNKKEEIAEEKEEVKNNNKLDDLDLNNSDYEKALEVDKRTLFQIYWSRLKAKHLIIYTFISCHDYNLIYIKISRFVFLVCTSMALNVFFFFDKSMHKIYEDYGKYNFIKQLPQILYSTIVSLIIEILIGILSYTDINIYQIRKLEKATFDKIIPIFKKIKIKLILYFTITFLLFLFYWYFISAFCAVYNNTQIIYIKDFVSSFSIGLLYPFIIQFAFTLIRIFTLRKNTKVRSVLYKIC